MKILVVSTGGTIGSVVTEKGIGLSENKLKILELYQNQMDTSVLFETAAPFSLLSENMDTETWVSIAAFLKELRFDTYDGVILTHGSDTLSFTAAFLSCCFAHIQIPLVLVAANYPLEDKRSNGLQNFSAAVELIRSKSFRGVFVTYGNMPEQTEVYLGTRLCAADCFCDFFRDFTGIPLCVYKNGSFNWNRSPYNPTKEEMLRKKPVFISWNHTLENRVKIVFPYPGLDYPAILPDNKTKAVLHLAYHSGTACVTGGLIPFIRECKDRGADVYLASLKRKENFYVTTNKILNAGAAPLYNISAEAAYAKLLLAYNQEKLNTEEFLNKDIFFETVI